MESDPLNRLAPELRRALDGNTPRDSTSPDRPRGPLGRGRREATKRIKWTPDRLWLAWRAEDKTRVATTLGCGLSNVYARIQAFRSTTPGGSAARHFVDRDIHLQMGRMLQDARYEALAAVAFLSPAPPPVFDDLLAASRRGVRVRLLFRSDNLTGHIVRSLQDAGVAFRTLADLHAKFLVTDTTAMNGSANLTTSSADRASEVATFFSDPALVYELRTVFSAYWRRARPF
ncbi:MAG: phospholipase D family protein [Rhodothermales bacterium]|nr:phospholipase D family protein [Rhodothermales bacterium]MBO6779412.1 phospholipase D family protein [Rhodothermales bacterium]